MDDKRRSGNRRDQQMRHKEVGRREEPQTWAAGRLIELAYQSLDPGFSEAQFYETLREVHSALFYE